MEPHKQKMYNLKLLNIFKIINILTKYKKKDAYKYIVWNILSFFYNCDQFHFKKSFYTA